MSSFRILIVEDEVLIADAIERCLIKKGYEVTGKAISYEEAVEQFQQQQPDLILLDIRLNGARTGVDVAEWLQQQPRQVPFVYLTSQLDSQSLDAAKSTYPAGYLSKPVQPQSLYTTIEIALHNHNAQEAQKTTIRLYNGKQYYQVLVDNILCLRAEHIYVKVTLANREEFIQRATLKEMIDQLPEGQFVQTHRSYAVNIQQISRWDQAYLYVQGHAVPLSRSRRRQVFDLLEQPGEE